MANTWIMIRHPHKEGDAEGMYYGNESGITPEGYLQITEVIDRLRKWNQTPQLVTTSTLPRAYIPAKAIAHTLRVPVVPADLFDEIDKPAVLVGKRRSSREHIRVMRLVRALFDENKVPEGIHVKRRTQLETQTRQAFRYIEQLPCETVLTMSHAKRIASYLHWVLKNEKTLRGYYAESDPNFTIDTMGITVLRRKPDRRTGHIHWHVQTVNDTAHADVRSEGNPEHAELLSRMFSEQ